MPKSEQDGENPGADLSNWRTAPFSRWAFHNVRKILPVAAIAHAPNIPLHLPAAPHALEGFRVPGPDGETLGLAGFMAATATDALVILRDGELAFEAYANGNDAETPHILMSASKAVAGLIVGALHGAGELDVEAKASAYLPEIAGTAYEGASIRNLLDMRTGVVLEGAALQAYEAAANWDPVGDGETRPGFRAFFAGLAGPRKPHGGPFAYVSANTDLLGLVMERATGRKFADLASELFWRPMGAAQDAYVTLDVDGAPRCTGGLCATARDFARIGQLLLLDGRRDGANVVPAAWIEDIAGAGDRAAWREGEWGQAFASLGREMSYRSGWYIVHDEPEVMFAMGIHGQNLFVDRDNDLIVAKLSSLATPIDYDAIALTHAAVPVFRKLLAGPA